MYSKDEGEQASAKANPGNKKLVIMLGRHSVEAERGFFSRKGGYALDAHLKIIIHA
jgi:hypothetical protein